MKFEEGWLKRQVDRAAQEIKEWSPQKKATYLCPQDQHEWKHTNIHESEHVLCICKNCGYEEYILVTSNFKDHWGIIKEEIENE